MIECPRCRGCGQIANSEQGEPWSNWMALPLQSATAVLMGLVKPIPCPSCNGAGTVGEHYGLCPTCRCGEG